MLAISRGNTGRIIQSSSFYRVALNKACMFPVPCSLINNLGLCIFRCCMTDVANADLTGCKLSCCELWESKRPGTTML